MSSENVSKLLSLSESMGLSDAEHASHCMLYSTPDSTGLSYSLLQIRFDGRIGFPGGGVDEKDITIDNILEATNRELFEEINYEFKGVTEEEWICTHLESGSKVRHFFAKQITFEEFLWIEKNHMNAQHFASESLGVFRVPLSSSDEKCISKKFLNNFLRQKFAGNANQQFIQTIKKLSLLSPEDQQWIDGNDFTDDYGVNDMIELKTMLWTDISIHYNNETVGATYGLMIIRDNGLFDFLGSELVDSNDKNSLVEKLNNSLKADLSSKCLPIKLESELNDLSLSDGLNNLIFVNINGNQFKQIETTFTESENFNTKSLGIFRIPFEFRGNTQKAHNYVKRFFNGFLEQSFANHSKQNLKNILNNRVKLIDKKSDNQ